VPACLPACSAKKDFVRCGILRQLLGVVGGNIGKQYCVILKKVGRGCLSVWQSLLGCWACGRVPRCCRCCCHLLMPRRHLPLLAAEKIHADSLPTRPAGTAPASPAVPFVPAVQVLRVVDSLPLTADDLHHTRSAHGSFADLLRELAQSTDFEVGWVAGSHADGARLPGSCQADSKQVPVL
jgi:hypothetical protein